MRPLLLLPLAACLRFQLPVEEPVDDTGADTSPPVLVDPTIVWGDLHNHTNLSHDGCEDPDNVCLPDSDLPAEDAFPRAIAYGLGFAALTDHAEFTRYLRPDEGVDIDIWTRMQELVRATEGTSAFGIMGYEWTSSCDGSIGDLYQATHRTVLVEDVEGCSAWRIPSCHGTGVVSYGTERYQYSALEPAILPSELLARLQAVPDIEGCAPSRSIGFFHHVAQDRPAWVDWASAESWVEGDRVVEIASEHGSSECDTRVATEGCEWRYSSEHHVDDGSIQYMLQMGHELGFVGGTDNHMDEPGRVTGGPGRVRDLEANPKSPQPWHDQYTNGTLTGAIVTGSHFDRADLFDIVEARHTVAASWAAEKLVIYAMGFDGERYLPGDDVPAAAMPIVLTVTLGDPRVTEWAVDIVDAFGQVTAETVLTIPSGEARYVRIRAMQGEAEHRIFASPFFAD
ncbi:MAG: hypothetical protein Q8P18_02475 [Pseudomonadota bacterium]|nr:hypothetical protein [Pseudomonadota bacterium]